jgi:hypothetical protein
MLLIHQIPFSPIEQPHWQKEGAICARQKVESEASRGMFSLGINARHYFFAFLALEIPLNSKM